MWPSHVKGFPRPEPTKKTDGSGAARRTLAGTRDAGPMTEKTPFEAPHPGDRRMPRWDAAALIEAPTFTARNWFSLLGPGLVMGAAAIGGGEWLVGPRVTATYGGSLLWLATLSILGQVVYNIEISRYALYCGEPIFSGKFRIPPPFGGPMFWLLTYLLLDLGVIFPYLAANAATPFVTLMKGGKLPDQGDAGTMRLLSYAIFLGAMVPLFFGGRIYRSLKAIMTFKLVVVLGFLLVTAVFYSSWGTWVEIGTGFLKVGSLPVARPEGAPATANVDNLFVSLLEGRGFPAVDFTLIGFITALAAIAGSGGLTNTPISNYTRDQGWGMGHHVGAIPSMVGGHKIELAHVGSVFEVNEESLPRWRRWMRHVRRDQLAVWLPACFVGLALPCMLSVQFLERGGDYSNDWATAAMTADGVKAHVAAASGKAMGDAFWFMTIFCGFLVLGTGMISTVEGLIRRWVEVVWTSSARLREVDPGKIKNLYYTVLGIYVVFGLVMLSVNRPGRLITIATLFYNFALGVSCWHTAGVNLVLLPPALRPGLFMRTALVLAGCYFFLLSTVAVMSQAGRVWGLVAVSVAVAGIVLVALATKGIGPWRRAASPAAGAP